MKQQVKGFFEALKKTKLELNFSQDEDGQSKLHGKAEKDDTEFAFSVGKKAKKEDDVVHQ